MDSTLLDNRLKMQISAQFCEHFTKEEAKELNAKWDELITKNTLALGASHFHLVHQGMTKLRQGEDMRKLPRWDRNKLLPEFNAEFEEIMVEDRQFTADHSMLASLIAVVLNRAKCVQDLYSMLPESLHAPIHKRTGEENYYSSNLKLPDELMGYYNRALNWVTRKEVNKFLLGE